jgi:hypothetical protein
MVNFHHSPTLFYEVFYNRTRDIEETDVDNPERNYYEDLPDCETEEELHRAIVMREFTMHRVDHDIQVTNRYTQWLSTRVEDGSWFKIPWKKTSGKFPIGFLMPLAPRMSDDRAQI